MLAGWTIAIPGYLHQSKGAIIVRWKSALLFRSQSPQLKREYCRGVRKFPTAPKRLLICIWNHQFFSLIIRTGFLRALTQVKLTRRFVVS
jgi:hypothetical protein